MTKQPNICKELITEGWRFTWDATKKQVRAIQDEGADVALLTFKRSILDPTDVNEIGEAIVKLLSGASVDAIKEQH